MKINNFQLVVDLQINKKLVKGGAKENQENQPEEAWEQRGGKPKKFSPKLDSKDKTNQRSFHCRQT